MVAGPIPYTKTQAEKDLLAYLKRLAFQIPNFDLSVKPVYDKIKAMLDKLSPFVL